MMEFSIVPSFVKGLKGLLFADCMKDIACCCCVAVKTVIYAYSKLVKKHRFQKVSHHAIPKSVAKYLENME